MSTSYFPQGTVYGTLLNQRSEWLALGDSMSQPPHQAPPQAPVLYVKTANTWSASGSSVAVPARVPQVQLGVTLGLVMARDGHGLSTANALDYLAGLVLLCDLSVPHKSLLRPPVKFNCLDGFLGVGPSCVPLAQTGDPAALELQLKINGALQQTVGFAQLVRPAATLLSDVNEFMTLRHGDVLMLGCMADKPLAAAGDHIRLSSSCAVLGELQLTLTAEAA